MAKLVERIGKVSEVGAYPDKGFTLTEADFDAAVRDFAPVGMDVEHMPSVLDGHVGQLVSVWREGTALFGKFAVPGYLNSLFALFGASPAVSLEWDAGCKRIRKCAWVLKPRVPDAVLFSALAPPKADEVTFTVDLGPLPPAYAYRPATGESIAGDDPEVVAALKQTHLGRKALELAQSNGTIPRAAVPMSAQSVADAKVRRQEKERRAKLEKTDLGRQVLAAEKNVPADEDLAAADYAESSLRTLWYDLESSAMGRATLETLRKDLEQTAVGKAALKRMDAERAAAAAKRRGANQ